MLVGGGAICPGCQQNDATQKVSIIVHTIQDNLSPNEIEWLNSTVKDGQSTDWKTPQRGESWQRVGKKLEPPLRPELPWYARPNSSNIKLLGLSLFTLPFLAFFLLGRYVFQFGSFAVPFVCLMFIPIVVLNWRWFGAMTRAEKNLQPKLARWGEAMTQWGRLWYCARDNEIFRADELKPAPVEEMKTLLGEAARKVK